MTRPRISCMDYVEVILAGVPVLMAVVVAGAVRGDMS